MPAGLSGALMTFLFKSGEGNGNPFQYSCLENPMDRGAWEAAVHGVAKSWTHLSDFTLFKSGHLKQDPWNIHIRVGRNSLRG